jgi:hypothetical protein
MQCLLRGNPSEVGNGRDNQFAVVKSSCCLPLGTRQGESIAIVETGQIGVPILVSRPPPT